MKKYCTHCRSEKDFKIARDRAHVEALDSAHVVANDSAHVEANDSAHVVAWDSAHVEARGSAHVEAWGSAHVVARGSAHVVANDSAHVVAWGSAHVVARGSAHVEAWGSAHVEAWGGAHVVANDSAHVVANAGAHVEALGSAHVVARSPYVSVMIRSGNVRAVGGIRIGEDPLLAEQWLAMCGVGLTEDDTVVLYKSVNKDFKTRNGVSFTPGTSHEAPDWDPSNTQECGAAIHYSPTVAQARRFRDEGVYIACRVAIADMASLPAFAEYPDKIRAKGGVALYQCDAEGKRVSEAISAA